MIRHGLSCLLGRNPFPSPQTESGFTKLRSLLFLFSIEELYLPQTRQITCILYDIRNIHLIVRFLCGFYVSLSSISKILPFCRILLKPSIRLNKHQTLYSNAFYKIYYASLQNIWWQIKYRFTDNLLYICQSYLEAEWSWSNNTSIIYFKCQTTFYFPVFKRRDLVSRSQRIPCLRRVSLIF